jgi:hypothetical protein
MNDRALEQAVETERVEMVMEPMTVERFKRLNDPSVAVYPVSCDCGWFGMREDCRRGACPSCGDRVRRDNAVS